MSQRLGQIARGVQGVCSNDYVEVVRGESLSRWIPLDVQQAILDKAVIAKAIPGSTEEKVGKVGEDILSLLGRKLTKQPARSAPRPGAYFEDADLSATRHFRYQRGHGSLQERVMCA